MQSSIVKVWFNLAKVKEPPADSKPEEMEDLTLYLTLADVLLAIAAMLKRAELF